MITNDKHKIILDIIGKELSCSAHNLDILIPAALLHDVARVKEGNDKTGQTDHAVLGGEIAAKILRDLDYNEVSIEKIRHCIVTHRFRTGNKPKTIEAKILFDADKLDAIGAIGIARSFMLAGQSGQTLDN